MFNLYETEEFASALEEFQRNITLHFSDRGRVKWFDEYTMLVIGSS